MTVLRELIARLGFQVDKQGFAVAERSVAGVKAALGAASGMAGTAQAGLKGAAGAAAGLGDSSRKAAAGVAGTAGAMGMLGKLAATAGLTHVITSMVEMASDANETGNILNEVFGPQRAADIAAWSDKMGSAMGRSKYDLQAYAGRLGSVIEPMIHNKDKTLEMSTALSGLAVDLGSFFNVSDDDALAALRSGLTGEYESMKRLGIVLNDATLADFAHTKGIKKKTTAMSIAEKTQLRYDFIMANSTAAQGDAARTGDGYANAIKGVKAIMTELGTEMGMTVIPRLEKLLKFVRTGLTGFRRLSTGTNLLKSAMLVLSSVAVWLGASLAAPFIVPALAIGGLIILVDDLYTLFTGGKSIIGEWLDDLGGEGTADEFVRTLTEGFKTAKEAIAEFAKGLPDVRGQLELIRTTMENLGRAAGILRDKMANIVTAPVRNTVNLVPNLANELIGQDVVPTWDAPITTRTAGPSAGAPLLEGIGEQFEQMQNQAAAAVRAASDQRAVERALRQAEAQRAEERKHQTADAPTMTQLMFSEDARAPGTVGYGQANVRAAAPREAQSWGYPIGEKAPNITTNNTFNIHGDQRETERVVVKVLDARERKNKAALPGRGGS